MMIIKKRRGIAEHRGLAHPARRKGRLSLSSIQSNQPAPRDLLTPRERAVLAQIGRGATSKEAGAALGVSSRTIEFHRANIMRKLGARKIVDLMLLALRKNGE
jgi:DNA-binding CsgD family transcriptional regulator